jgi:hypothetical protein
MPDWLSLTGRFVHLLPLSIEHVPDLVSAATEDRATFTFSSAPRDEETMVSFVNKAIAHREAGDQRPFATWSVDLGRIVGTTRFYGIQRWDWSLTPRAHQIPVGSPPIGPRTGRPTVPTGWRSGTPGWHRPLNTLR